MVGKHGNGLTYPNGGPKFGFKHNLVPVVNMSRLNRLVFQDDHQIKDSDDMNDMDDVNEDTVMNADIANQVAYPL